jgi:hypothetical protein
MGACCFRFFAFAFAFSVSGFVGFSHSRPKGLSRGGMGWDGMTGGAELEERAFNDFLTF